MSFTRMKKISKDLETFLKCCFQKDPEHRLTARELLVHPWITHRTANTTTPVATSHEAIKNSLIHAGHPFASPAHSQSPAPTHAHGHAQTQVQAQQKAQQNHFAHITNRAERSDSSERTIVHRGRSFDYISSPASTPVSSSPLTVIDDDTSSLASLSRSSSFADALDRSSAECNECAQLRRALNEEKTKRQEILLTAINCILTHLFIITIFGYCLNLF